MGKRLSVFSAEVGRMELFISDCAACGVVFGIPVELEARRRDDHRSFYCPNGHVMVFSGLTEAEKQAKREKERADALAARFIAMRDQANAAEREAALARASEVRLRWRVGNGVCPCCSRTFAALARHVVAKHPEFVHQDIETLSAQMRKTLVTIHSETQEQDEAWLDSHELGLHNNTLRALETRGLVDRIDWSTVALTEAGWPVAEQLAGRS